MATAFVSSIFKPFQQELRKDSLRTYIGSKKGELSKRVFVDCSKTNKPIGIILVSYFDVFNLFLPTNFFGLIVSENKVFFRIYQFGETRF